MKESTIALQETVEWLIKDMLMHLAILHFIQNKVKNPYLFVFFDHLFYFWTIHLMGCFLWMLKDGPRSS